MERPALQKLLDDVRARRIDVIVVYKVDRLTRSLADFAKLVELFDAHGVSLISVTQAFNTTTSMGRLTLNMLLSFAQFEREITGERIRDKVAASKRKGIWMGGAVPLGYRVEDRALHVVESEAEFVRALYRRSAAWCASRPLLTPRTFTPPPGRAEPAERPAALRSREATSIGSYRTRSMSDGCATKGRSTTAFIRRS
jgi:DNA invertase Pin-like site-specific DNA recombinase